mgnify:FL=1
MNTVKINVCTDATTKAEAENLLSAMGLTMTAAINMYLKRIVMEGGIPFDVTTRVAPNKETLEALEEGRRIARDKSVPGYKSMEELKAALDV